MPTYQLWLVVEGIQLAASSAAKDHQHILGARAEVGLPRPVRLAGFNQGPERLPTVCVLSEQSLAPQEMGQGYGTEPEAGVAQEAPTIQQRMIEGRGDRCTHGMKRNSLALRTPRQKACNPSERTKAIASSASARCGVRLKANCHAART